jgi:hypothetical protein
MDATNALLKSEDTMQRTFEQHSSRDGFRTRFAAAGTTPGQPPAFRLPPTRAALPLRSRGVFFSGRWRARVGRWVLNTVCIAAASLAIAASAHFAHPAFDAAARNSNTGPALLASATRTASFLPGSDH